MECRIGVESTKVLHATPEGLHAPYGVPQHLLKVNIRRTGGSHSRQTVGSPAIRPDPRFGKRGYHTFGECSPPKRRKCNGCNLLDWSTIIQGDNQVIQIQH